MSHTAFAYLVLIAWVAGFLLLGIPIRSIRKQMIKQVNERLEGEKPFSSSSLWSIFTLLDLLASYRQFYPNSPLPAYYGGWYLLAFAWFVGGIALLR